MDGNTQRGLCPSQRWSRMCTAYVHVYICIPLFPSHLPPPTHTHKEGIEAWRQISFRRKLGEDITAVERKLWMGKAQWEELWLSYFPIENWLLTTPVCSSARGQEPVQNEATWQSVSPFYRKFPMLNQVVLPACVVRMIKFWGDGDKTKL